MSCLGYKSSQMATVILNYLWLFLANVFRMNGCLRLLFFITKKARVPGGVSLLSLDCWVYIIFPC